jgi:hypothetical protein
MIAESIKQKEEGKSNPRVLENEIEQIADCTSTVYMHPMKYLKPTHYLPGFSGFPAGMSTVMLITTSCAGISTSSTPHSIPR